MCHSRCCLRSATRRRDGLLDNGRQSPLLSTSGLVVGAAPVKRARHVPAYLSFAIWEWVTCGVLTIHVTGLALAASAERAAA
jgi:hypothetical protein